LGGHMGIPKIGVKHESAKSAGKDQE